MKTMKYLAMTLMGAFLINGAAMAQDGDDMNQKGQSGDISVGFNYDFTPNINIGGLLGGGGAAPSTGNQWRNDAFGNAQIFGRYYLSDDLAVRVGLGLNSNSSTSINKDSATWGETLPDSDGNPVSVGSDSASFTETEANSSQFNFSIAPGIEKHFSTNSNVDPYVGLQIPLAFLGATSTDSTITREGYNTGSDNQVNYEYSSDSESPGGFGWGVQGIVGFNYFLSDKIALGAEYTLGFMNTSTGGEATGDWEANGSIGGTSHSDSGSDWNHETESSEGGIQTMSRGGINVSIFF